MRPAGKGPPGLREVRAAQLRARALAGGIGKAVLGTIFLLGALSYAYGPEPTSQTSLLWMAALVVLSTFHVGLGLRTIARVRRRATVFWLSGTLAWGVLATILLRILTLR